MVLKLECLRDKIKIKIKKVAKLSQRMKKGDTMKFTGA